MKLRDKLILSFCILLLVPLGLFVLTSADVGISVMLLLAYGAVILAAWLLEDARKKKEQEERERQLIRNIAHDIKTPLTSIRGYAEGLLDGVAQTKEQQRSYLQMIVRKAGELDALVNELGDASEIAGEGVGLDASCVSAAEYFSALAEGTAIDLKDAGIDFFYENTASLDAVMQTDCHQLDRVMHNLIDNAVRYMDKEDGRIMLRVSERKDAICVDVEDNGRGIAPEDLPHIFKRTFRGDAARSTAVSGSGLGLSIVKQIVCANGGKVWATSTPGLGTVIHFTLPRTREKVIDKCEGGED